MTLLSQNSESASVKCQQHKTYIVGHWKNCNQKKKKIPEMCIVLSLDEMHFYMLNVIEIMSNNSNWTMQKHKELNLELRDTLGKI
jgi:hypothetical protein